MPQKAVRRERPDLYKGFNPAERLDNNRSLGLARDLALRQAQGRLCGLPLGSRRSPHSRPQNGSTTTDPSASLGISPFRRLRAGSADSHSARGPRLPHPRQTARPQHNPPPCSAFSPLAVLTPAPLTPPPPS